MSVLLVLLGLSLVRTPKRGREQRRRTEKGQRRIVNPNRYYENRIANIVPGEFVFRIILVRTEYRRKRKRFLTINRFVEALTWTEDGSTTSGSATLRRPERLRSKSLPVRRGQGIRLDVRWRRKWYRLWTMPIIGEPDVDRTTGIVSIELGDPIDLLRRDERDWEYRKDARHKDGWRAHQVAADVARKVGLPVGRLSKGKVELERIRKKKGTAYEVLKEAYAQEADEDHRKYLIEIRNGKLVIRPLRRNRILYVVKAIERSSGTTSDPKNAQPATVIKATGRTKGGEKIELTIARPRVVRRLGRVTKEYDAGRVDGRGELREKAKRELERELRVNRTADIELPILPFIRRGEALKWSNREPGWHGPGPHTTDRQIGYVESVTHSLTPTSGSTAITLGQRDEFLRDQRRRDKELRDDKEKKREAKKR